MSAPLLPCLLSARAESCHCVAQYLVALYRHLLQPSSKEGSKIKVPSAPINISETLAEGCLAVAYIFASAVQYQLTWDNKLMSGAVKQTAMRAKHHKDNQAVSAGPAVFTGVKGHILAWSPPGVLPMQLQLTLANSAALLQPQFNTDHIDEDKALYVKWRTADKMYTPGEKIKSGQVFLGPAWFPPGRSPPKFDLIALAPTRTQEAQHLDAWVTQCRSRSCAPRSDLLRMADAQHGAKLLQSCIAELVEAHGLFGILIHVM
ncbi:hypothetical protein C8Q80DRAFT_1121253 [Daedaleopsis nitida]|nr:hypothetical protein C8Q80DRAFT_1121253 [Daedaleopsis nitida]